MIIELDDGERSALEDIIIGVIKHFMVCQSFDKPIPCDANIHETILTFSENTYGYWRNTPCSVNITGAWGILNASFTHALVPFMEVRLLDVKIEVSDEKPFAIERFSDWLALTKLMEESW